jgi:hypothetical protein
MRPEERKTMSETRAKGTIRLAASLMAAGILAFSCEPTILMDIDADIDAALSSSAPVINSLSPFSLVTNQTLVAFEVSGTANIAAWLVNENPDAPAANAAGWTPTRPTSYTLAGADGQRTIYVWAKDAKGQISKSRSLSVFLDRVAPSATLAISSASPTINQAVNISLTGDDGTGSGISYWLVKEGPESPAPAVPSFLDSGWATEAPTSFSLSAGSGTKYLYAWARDAAANIVATARASIVYQDPGTSPALNSFTLTAPSVYTTSRVVDFNLVSNIYATSWYLLQVDRGSVPTAPAAGAPGWLNTHPTSFTLADGDGAFDIYAWVKNEAGQIAGGLRIQATLDRAKPIISTVALGGSSVDPSTSASITLNCSASDGSTGTGVRLWYLSESSSEPDPATDSGWVIDPSSFTLSAPSALKTIHVWAKDYANNMSTGASLQVTYWNPTYIPELTAFGLTGSDQGATPGYTKLRDVPLSISVDPDSTYWLISLSPAIPAASQGYIQYACTGWIPISPNGTATHSFQLPDTDQAYTLYAWAKNNVNQISATAVPQSIHLDRVAPTEISISLGGGSSDPSAAQTVNVSLSGSDGASGSGISAWYLSENPSAPDPAAASGWAANPTSFILSDHSGAKTIHAWAKDRANNLSAVDTLTIDYFDPDEVPGVASFSHEPSANVTNGYSSSTSIGFSLSLNSFASAYLITTSTDTPTEDQAFAAGTCSGWVGLVGGTSTTSSFTISGTAGTYALYAWAKNSVGQIALSGRRSITVVYDTTAPVLTINTVIPAATDIQSGILEISDTGSPTQWFVRLTEAAPENQAPPTLGEAGWVGTKPSSYNWNHPSPSVNGSPHTLYYWARDAAGNISAEKHITTVLYPTPAVIGLSPGTIIAGHESIVLTFNVSMDTDVADVTLTGTLMDGLALGTDYIRTWSKTSLSNDTLTISPPDPDIPVNAPWTAGAKTLTVNGRSAVEITMSAYNQTFTVEDVVYVDASMSGDSGPGTRAKPYKLIPSAIEKADTIYKQDNPSRPSAVRVAEGTYNVSYAASTHIVMREGISLLGGYKNDWSNRDLSRALYQTTINDSTDSVGTSSLSGYARALDCGTGLSTSTVIEGLIIKGGSNTSSTSYTSALYCADSSPTIRSCSVFAGAGGDTNSYRYGIIITGPSGSVSPMVTDCAINSSTEGGSTAVLRCVGIFLGDNAKPTIEGNVIHGGKTKTSTGGYSYCIQTAALTSTPIITGNELYGGTSFRTYCAYFYGSDSLSEPLLIQNNLLRTGISNASGNEYGIYSVLGITVRNNIIVLYRDPSESDTVYCYGIALSQGGAAICNPSIDNNIFIVQQEYTCYGVYEYNALAPSHCRNNDFYEFVLGYGQHMYHDSSGDFDTISEVNTADNNASDNIDDDPVLTGTYHFTTGTGTDSPVSVTEGGLNLHGDWEDAAYKDDDELRPSSGGWSMGCYKP